MRTTLGIVLVAGLIGMAIFFSRSFITRNNISDRERYWTKEISTNLKPGADQSQLEEFLQPRGEKLHCYQTYAREDQCDITDSLSVGGTTKMPMKLSVIFKMKDKKVVSHLFTTTLANQPQ
jgi:hypothetical protein